MPFSTAGRNTAADALAVTHLSLHTAAPNDAGSNEVTGSGYARKAVTLGAASGGVRSATGLPTEFSGPPDSGVAAVGYWAGGTFLAYDLLDAGVDDLNFNVAGKYSVTEATLTVT